MLVAVSGIFGQDATGSPGGEGDGLGDSDGAPIDGGLSILLAAGVGYGVKKMNDQRKKNKVDSNIEK